MSTRRGLTIIELMLALTITAMVASAIAATLGAVTSGVVSRADNRQVTVRSSAAHLRLSAYVAPARALLHRAADGSELVVWFDDARQGRTVHAREIRWLRFDPVGTCIVVQYVRFPEAWGEAAKDLADLEFGPNADWNVVRTGFDVQGHLKTLRLIDGVALATFDVDAPAALDSRHLTARLDMQTSSGAETFLVTSTVRHPVTPMDL